MNFSEGRKDFSLLCDSDSALQTQQNSLYWAAYLKKNFETQEVKLLTAYVCASPIFQGLELLYLLCFSADKLLSDCTYLCLTQSTCLYSICSNLCSHLGEDEGGGRGACLKFFSAHSCSLWLRMIPSTAFAYIT